MAFIIYCFAIDNQFVPPYFSEIKLKLHELKKQKLGEVTTLDVVGGGTDLYVQKHDDMPHIALKPLFDNKILKGVKWKNGWFTMGASATVTDLKESPEMNAAFPHLQKHLKLVSSTPIRNMATIAGNLVNASPIGDMTVFLLALNATIFLQKLFAQSHYIF